MQPSSSHALEGFAASPRNAREACRLFQPYGATACEGTSLGEQWIQVISYDAPSVLSVDDILVSSPKFRVI